MPVFLCFHAEGVYSNTIRDIYTGLCGFFFFFTFSFLSRNMTCKRSAVTLAQKFVYWHYAIYCYTEPNHTSFETNDNKLGTNFLAYHVITKINALNRNLKNCSTYSS